MSTPTLNYHVPFFSSPGHPHSTYGNQITEGVRAILRWWRAWKSKRKYLIHLVLPTARIDNWTFHFLGGRLLLPFELAGTLFECVLSLFYLPPVFRFDVTGPRENAGFVAKGFHFRGMRGTEYQVVWKVTSDYVRSFWLIIFTVRA